MGQPVPFRRRFSHLSIGLPLSFLSGLFAEITSPPFFRGGPKPELPTPVTYFPRRYRDCDPFCRARERPKRSNSAVRHSTFAPQMQQADRPTATRQSTLPQCTHSLSASILFGEAFFTRKGIIGARKAPSNSSGREQGVFSCNTVRAY